MLKSIQRLKGRIWFLTLTVTEERGCLATVHRCVHISDTIFSQYGL